MEEPEEPKEGRICPVCRKPTDSESGVYRIGDKDYHRECYATMDEPPGAPEGERVDPDDGC